MNKHKIEVWIKSTQTQCGIIHRVLRAECIGNFNPVFCTYQYKKYLVKSKDGDLSDSFRREDTYLNSLYIEV